MDAKAEFGVGYAAEQLRRARHPFRSFVKRFYLSNILEDVRGATIDLGCGAGQLLACLPAGSMGLEVNPYLVEALEAEGLNVRLYDARADDFSMSALSPGTYRSLVIAHVLEHFEDAEAVMRKLWAAAARLGVERIVVIVPGAIGYRSDNTHKTFISLDYLEQHDLREIAGFSLVKTEYFPVDVAWLGFLFAYHELKCVYDRQR